MENEIIKKRNLEIRENKIDEVSRYANRGAYPYNTIENTYISPDEAWDDIRATRWDESFREWLNFDETEHYKMVIKSWYDLGGREGIDRLNAIDRFLED